MKTNPKQVATMVLERLVQSFKDNGFTDEQIAYIELTMMTMLREKYDR